VDDDKTSPSNASPLVDDTRRTRTSSLASLLLTTERWYNDSTAWFLRSFLIHLDPGEPRFSCTLPLRNVDVGTTFP
jgi:hypothetical protein